MYGSNCEVLIVDLNNPQNSIIAIYNGHVTGRKVGDALSGYGLRVLRNAPLTKDLINYSTKTPDGRLLKCSTIILTSKGLNLAFGINFEYSNLSLAQSILQNLIMTNEQVDETFYKNSSEILENMIDEVIKIIGKPPSLMSKSDRLTVVKYLDERGAFLIQKSSQTVAKRLNVSRYTIYNYLNELKSKNMGQEEKK